MNPDDLQLLWFVWSIPISPRSIKGDFHILYLLIVSKCKILLLVPLEDAEIPSRENVGIQPLPWILNTFNIQIKNPPIIFYYTHKPIIRGPWTTLSSETVGPFVKTITVNRPLHSAYISFVWRDTKLYTQILKYKISYRNINTCNMWSFMQL